MLEAKYEFIKNNIFLIAQINEDTGRQKLVMQKINLSNGEIIIEDSIDCIHTAITDISADELEDILSEEEDSEELMNGELLKIKATVVESTPNRKVGFKLSFPLSFMCPKLEWQIEPKGPNSVFTAVTYYKFGKLFLKFGKKRADKILETTKKHTKEEGENLKKILEKKNR